MFSDQREFAEAWPNCRHSAAIDTNDDAEGQMDRTWEGPVDELDGMLGAAMALVEQWKARERTRPDPPSPW